MADLREIRRRIKSVENTRKITRAMEMVAGAKLKQLDAAATRAREYTEGLKQLLIRLIGENPGTRHPLFEIREEIRRTALVLITSDTGLCGAYNADLIAEAERYLRVKPAGTVDLIAVGVYGLEYFKRRSTQPKEQFTEFKSRVDGGELNRLVEVITNLFTSRRVDEADIISCYYRSASNWGPRRMRFLGFEVDPGQNTREGEAAGPVQAQAYPSLLEPDAQGVFDMLIPRTLEGQLRQILLEAFSAEQSSRMMAMRNATENADDMIKDLTITRNKVRQAQITKDIIEVVSGAEGLKS